MPGGASWERATDDLLRGQSNDVYWHGLFGGIYLPHLRLANFAHLIAAEDTADQALGTRRAWQVLDLDLDGRDDVRLADEGQVVTVDLDEGAGIGDWDIRAARHALAAVLRRRPEAYHETLRREANDSPVADGDLASGAGDAALSSIHDIIRSKEAGLADRLIYDDHERRSGLLRFLPLEATAASYGAGEIEDLGNALVAPHSIVELGAARLVVSSQARIRTAAGDQDLEIRKEITLAGDRLQPTLRVAATVRNTSKAALACRLGQEWSVMLLGGGGNPSAWYEVGGARGPHDGRGEAAGIARIAQGNDWVGIALTSLPTPVADAWWAPIETISNSDNGFERVYQGSALLFSWVVTIEPLAEVTVAVEQRVTVKADRAGS